MDTHPAHKYTEPDGNEAEILLFEVVVAPFLLQSLSWIYQDIAGNGALYYSE